MSLIITTVLTSIGLAFLLGFLLGLFKKIFSVKVDKKVSDIRNILPGANCGGCGYAGCDAFAAAVASGEAAPGGCSAGGADVSDKLGKLLGVNINAEKKVALLACQGSKDCAGLRGTYSGVKSCLSVTLAVNNIKKCSFGCIGLGDCVAVCPFDALSIGENGLPQVNYENCVGCGKCAKACPKHLFDIIPASRKGAAALCRNRADNRPQIKKDCTAGCIKCGLCEKKCPEHCIVVINGIPETDYAKCTSCGVCAQVCPDKVIKMTESIVYA